MSLGVKGKPQGSMSGPFLFYFKYQHTIQTARPLFIISLLPYLTLTFLWSHMVSWKKLPHASHYPQQIIGRRQIHTYMFLYDTCPLMSGLELAWNGQQIMRSWPSNCPQSWHCSKLIELTLSTLYLKTHLTDTFLTSHTLTSLGHSAFLYLVMWMCHIFCDWTNTSQSEFNFRQFHQKQLTRFSLISVDFDLIVENVFSNLNCHIFLCWNAFSPLKFYFIFTHFYQVKYHFVFVLPYLCLSFKSTFVVFDKWTTCYFRFQGSLTKLEWYSMFILCTFMGKGKMG